jgi:elongation factor 4
MIGLGVSRRWLCGHRYHLKLSSFSSLRDIVKDGGLLEIPCENIRNFSIIAHIDHGKSTLADALLERTGNISRSDRKSNPQIMDRLQVERERGITVKAQTASMIYADVKSNENIYLINMIDTPGHVDFSYEVSRSLVCCEGCLLLVDSTQNIQAQTLDTFAQAKALGLKIIPVLTKTDLPHSRPLEVALTMSSVLGVDPDAILLTSAKEGKGIDHVIKAIIDQIPPPNFRMGGDDDEYNSKKMKSKSKSLEPFLGRIVDSWFDKHRGVVCLVQCTQGNLKEGQRLAALSNVKAFKCGDTLNITADPRNGYNIQEVGVLTPEPLRTNELKMGHVGYVIAGLRSTRQAQVGDTLYIPTEWDNSNNKDVFPEALDGYKRPQSMIYASLYPCDNKDLEILFAAIDRLCLNDSSLSISRQQTSSFGAGLHCGFLGMLHMEVIIQRLRDEYNIPVVLTTPSVPYLLRNTKTGDEIKVSSVVDWPETDRLLKYETLEPVVEVQIITPEKFVGEMLTKCKEYRGKNIESDFILDSNYVSITATIPWKEVVVDFSDTIKNISRGYASLKYSDAGYEKSSLHKVDILVNGKICDPLSFIHHYDSAALHARRVTKRLKETIKRQHFEIIIQAKLGAKIIARERIQPYRKNVLMKSGKLVGGGDESRKKKLLQRQKEGKKRAKMVGNVEINQTAFWSAMQR